MKIKRPPIFAFIYLGIAIVLSFIFSDFRVINFPINLIGIIFLAIGIFLMGSSLNLFKKRGTTHQVFKKPSKLVTSGLFRISRNPIYLGMVSILFGVAFLIGDLLMFMAPIAQFLTLNFVFIPKEEDILEKIFKNKYLDYKRKVRRWV